MSTIETSTWTSSNGATRHYIQNLAEVLGVEAGYHKTGNLRWVEVDGRSVSNAAGYDLLATKAWIDTEGRVHVEGVGRKSPLSADEILARIEAARA